MDFITLKIHRPRPSLNPRTLGPEASMLTTTPPRATSYLLLAVYKRSPEYRKGVVGGQNENQYDLPLYSGSGGWGL
jgi:hypothetical protein